MSEDFIEGIYNYCDRWCERCAFSDRCLVYYREKQMMERHLLRGEDPDDPEVVARDVGESLQEALEMLTEMAQEMGVTVDSTPPRRRRRVKKPEEDPLIDRAMRWSDRLGALLDRVREELPRLGEEIEDVVDSEQKMEAAVDALTALRDDSELIARYRHLIPVKLMRATRTAEDDGEEEETNEELDFYARQDAVGTAKVVLECLQKTIAALWRIGELHRPWLEETLPLANEAEAIRGMVDERFPEHKQFHRPGFDDIES